MATWIDVVSFIIFLGVFGGAIYGSMWVMGQITSSIENTKQSLKSRGVEVKNGGVSVKTNKRMDRSDYIDATQRAMIDGMKKASKATHIGGASTIDPSSPAITPSASTSSTSNSYIKPPEPKRQDSTSSTTSAGGTKKRGLFSRKNSSNN